MMGASPKDTMTAGPTSILHLDNEREDTTKIYMARNKAPLSHTQKSFLCIESLVLNDSRGCPGLGNGGYYIKGHF